VQVFGRRTNSVKVGSLPLAFSRSSILSSNAFSTSLRFFAAALFFDEDAYLLH